MDRDASGELSSLSEVLPATPKMAPQVSALVHLSFNELAAPDWEPEARRVFLAESAPSRIAEALQEPAFAGVVWREDELVGFALMRQPNVVAMLFVHPAHLRKGIARRLWNAARAHVESAYPETRTVELNSTPYALPAYRALGFVPVSAEFMRDGCRATRMACSLPARALRAGVP